jgi:predicted MPP superfamily phosphohydrolase
MFIAVAVLVALAVYAFAVEPARLVVQHTSIALEAWPAAMPPLRIALISDVHADSAFIDDAKLARIVSLTNSEHPDLILILGDSIAHRPKVDALVEPEHIAAMLRPLHARFGVFGILGNHDNWFDGPRVKQAYERAGIPTLVNETRRVAVDGGAVSLVGLADLITGRPDLTLIDRAEPPVIVMTHSPDIFPRVSSRAALTVAGHTHGGQVWLPFAGRLIVPSRYRQRYAFGHVVEAGRHLFVTSGIGTSIIPVRFCVTPEIRILDLRSANPAARPSPARSTPATP